MRDAAAFNETGLMQQVILRTHPSHTQNPLLELLRVEREARLRGNEVAPG